MFEGDLGLREGAGKSQIAVEIALSLEKLGRRGEVINMDSMQVYQGFPIATNVPSLEEMRGIPHHLFSFLDPTVVDYSAHTFVEQASQLILSIMDRGDVPILVGGTHYYLVSLLWPNPIKESGLNDSQGFTGGIPDESTASLYKELCRVDPLMAEKLHQNARRKIEQSVAFFRATGKPYSEQMLSKATDSSRSRWPCCFLWLDSDINVLEERLNHRVDQMMARGLLKELDELVAVFRARNIPLDFTKGLLQSIGGKEFEEYLHLRFPLQFPFQRISESHSETKEVHEAIQKGTELLKIKTRQYALKQRPWIHHKIQTKTGIFRVPVTGLFFLPPQIKTKPLCRHL